MENMRISAFLKRQIDGFKPAPVTYRKGTVTKSGDGVVKVRELPGRQYGELLEFDGGVFGMVFDLEEDGAGVVLLDGDDRVKVGDGVKGTDVVAQVPVGSELLGRVIDPIGRPLDGKPINAEKFYPAERPAPAIIERRPVDTPMMTGLLAVDSMIPIGRGQRELIIGDRQTGKTTIAVDSIINQKDKDMICVYCATGQKASSVSGVVDTLAKAGAMKYTVVVAATAADSPAMQYLAPYCACSVAEYFEEQGKDVLIIYDDLSKHAVAYRTISLLLLRPPGREAYPGDIFYLHSRLLERSACLSHEKGGGSITALPIIETTAGDISAYIPTNVISITDGQIYLESDLFHSGVRPAVNTGLSVSRVGRAAQYQAMKDVSGTLRIELSQYREMAVFARFGSDVDPATKRMLDRGETLVNIFKQGRNEPYSLFDEAALLIAYKAEYFNGVKSKDFAAAVKQLLSELADKMPDAKKSVNETGNMTAEVCKLLENTIKSTTDGKLS